MTDPRPGDLFKAGDVVNNTYRIEAILGRGGTSDVYRARSEISGRVVAIKVLKSEFASNLDFLSLMTREEEMREIRHDAVVRYSENHRTADGHVFLVMDYVDGPGLDRRMRDGPVPADELLTICRRVCGGLEAAHARKIVHRDLSPDNIILKDGDPAQAVIIDFGIAKDTNPGAETIVGNEFAGKYAYAAPEQLAGRTDNRTDIYSLGALLLACFRGKAPDAGRNPMEVVERKAQPLDLTGVPEPLRAILARMTHPDPAKRFQSAAGVIAAVDAGGAAEPIEAAPEDRTIIVPKPRPAEEITGVAPERRTEAASPRRSRLPLVVGGLVALSLAALAVVFAAGLFDRILGPAYPPADPYTLTLSRPEGAALAVSGFVPDEDTQLALQTRSEEEGGFADLTLASGEIGPSWGADVRALLDIVEDLDSFEAEVEGDSVVLTGASSDRAAIDAVEARLAPGMPGGLSGTVDLTYEAPVMTAEEIDRLLAELADCGALELVGAPAVGYRRTDTVRVAGALSSAEAVSALRDALTAAVAPRPVAIDTAVLNPQLCLIDNFLPVAPPSDISIRFAEGGTGETGVDQSGRFLVGQNPVIDIVLPAEVTDGFLSVSILDVSGNVFHLLPNLSRPDNSVAALRDGREGEIAIRVAHEIGSEGGLAFRVDDSTLGKSKVIVLHSSAPLFDEMRPTTESAEGYAQSLGDQSRREDARILSLDTRILETASN